MVKNMAIKLQERLYDIHDLWQLYCQTDSDTKYEIIDGELIEMAGPGVEHGYIAGEIYYFIRQFDSEKRLGIGTVEAGHHPPDNPWTLLIPDYAFTRRERVPQPIPKKWMPLMPDLAVEVKSPSNTLAELRLKAAIYLRNGTQIVWLVLPAEKSVEVFRLGRDGEIEYEFIGETGSLSGETVLPGFRLELKKLFA